jgi:transposase InsO family protein
LGYGCGREDNQMPCWRIISIEEVYLNEYVTFNDALANIDRFIKDAYNSKCLHSSIGSKSPINFEKALTLNLVPGTFKESLCYQKIY